MAYREFRDSRGVVWTVWDVHPQSSALRRLSSHLESGWLAFESTAEKRRFTPIPEGWEESSDLDLERLCRSATASVRQRTL